MDLPDSDRGDFSCRRAVDSSSYYYYHYYYVRKYCQALNMLHFVGFRATEISQEMKILIVQQKMFYQKHKSTA